MAGQLYFVAQNPTDRQYEVRSHAGGLALRNAHQQIARDFCDALNQAAERRNKEAAEHRS